MKIIPASYTTRLVELHERGMSISEAGRNVGVPKTTAWRVAKKVGYHGGKGKAHPKCRKYYTVYLNKNDSIMAFGTEKECAEQMGMGRNTFRSTVCRAKKGKNKKYSIIVDDDAEI